MAKIYNSQCTKRLAANAGIQQSKEKVPEELAEKIIPTFETNPELLKDGISLGVSKTTTGEGKITIPSSTRDFYITGFNAGMIKDATCDVETGNLQIYITPGDSVGSTYSYLAYIPVITLTAQSWEMSQTFRFPIRIQRGTSIGITGTYANGTMIRNLTIQGYYVDSPNA